MLAFELKAVVFLSVNNSFEIQFNPLTTEAFSGIDRVKLSTVKLSGVRQSKIVNGLLDNVYYIIWLHQSALSMGHQQWGTFCPGGSDHKVG